MKRRMAVVRAAALGAALMTAGLGSAWAQTVLLPRFILKATDGSSATATAVAQAVSSAQSRYGVTITTLRTLPTGGQVMQVNRALTRTELQNLITDLDRSSATAYVHEDTVLKKQMTPNDARFNEQWNYIDAKAGINLQGAWDMSTGSGVRIAVLDSGYRPNSDLMPNVLAGYDFISDPFIANDGDGRDSSALDPGDGVDAGMCGPNTPAVASTWHGTAVTGMLAATANNGTGIAGVAFNSKIVPIRVVGRCGARISDVAEAAIWAAGGSIQGVPANPFPAKVINMSLAAPGACDPTSQGVMDMVRQLGAVVVAAAGNFNMDAANFIPASCNGVITVAATTKQGGKAPTSNFGEAVDISAPGGDMSAAKGNGVLTTLNFGTSGPGSDGFDYFTGTSIAAPQVAGVVALMLSRSNLLPDQVEDMLRSTARPFPEECNGCGEGILDAQAAVYAATHLPQPVAFLRGGIYEPKYAGMPTTFIAEQLGVIVDYRLIRRNGVNTQEWRQTTPVFNIPALGCVGEGMLWTLIVTDALGRSDTWSQRTSFFFHPNGASLPCGR